LKAPFGTIKRNRVAAIRPGWIETPEDVANVYALLASDEATQIVEGGKE